MSETISPKTSIAQYTIVSKIGEGGMGEVYLAEDTRLHRKVALKILPSDLAASKDRMRRFEQEAQAAAALNHPNIATIHEIGEHNGVWIIQNKTFCAERKRAADLDPLSPIPWNLFSTIYVQIRVLLIWLGALGCHTDSSQGKPFDS